MNTACVQPNFVLSCLVSLFAAPAMFHKRDKEYQQGLPPSKKLKANIGDLCLSNQISAQRAQDMYKDVADAGLLSADMKHLSKGLHSGIAKKQGGREQQEAGCSGMRGSKFANTSNSTSAPVPPCRCLGKCVSEKQFMDKKCISWRKEHSGREARLCCKTRELVKEGISFLFVELCQFMR